LHSQYTLDKHNYLSVGVYVNSWQNSTFFLITGQI